MRTHTNDSLRELERQSIAAFVEQHADLFKGRTLDYGSGHSPFRSVVEHAGGDYVAFDRAAFPGSVISFDVGDDAPLLGNNDVWDAILCTQVIQYLKHPEDTLEWMQMSLKPGCPLVITGPTNWQEVERDDLWRFTLSGIEELLRRVGFTVQRVVERASVEIGPGVRFSLGWGAVARA